MKIQLKMKKNTIYFYHDKRSLNEATSIYVKTIVENFKEKYNIKYVNFLKEVDVKKHDIIFTITSLYYCKAKLKYPFNVHFFWAQGVSPEEYYMFNQKKDYKFFLKTLMEKFAIKNSNFNFLVSRTMLEHYEKKYNYIKDNYLIMPCFNIHSLYEDDKVIKNEHSFVYAGNLAKWQCIEEMLSIFEAYQSHVPEATICFYTRDRIELEKIIDKYKLKNYTINFVAVDKLQKELLKYKFGFIIREDNIVNNVSTPTKMNSYLANGVIPIYTNAIDDFNWKLSGLKFCIQLNCDDSIKQWSQEIITYERFSSIDSIDFKREMEFIFEKYYSRNFYIEKNSDYLKSL